MNFPELVLKANTRDLGDAEKDLDRLAKKGEQTEDRIERSNQGQEDSFKRLSAGAGKAIGGLVTAIVSYQTAALAFSAAKSFDAALAETSTLIEATEKQMDFLSAAAIDLANDFGTDATQQVQAFYQAISAGASSVEEAALLLRDANKLAEGGVTDVTTAVGILSGVVNSYGKEAITTAEVSDALFVGMRAGVTTVDQLAGSVGAVIPIAKALGLSFDETIAATAALTKNNLSTSVAVTSLNAALTAVSGPTKQAQELAESLGLEFNSTALQAKGFGAFMADVSEKTGGSVDAMRALFGSVEGMKAALLFAGEAGGQYNDIMESMAEKIGQTDEAVAKINASLSDRLDDSLARLGILALEFGQALLVVAVPALEAFVAGATLMSNGVEVLGVGLAFLAATQIPALVGWFGLLTAGMTTTTIATGALTAGIGYLKAALVFLGGPLGILAGLAAAAGAAFLLFRDDAGEAEAAMYDAKAGSEALNIALNEFTTSGAPSAGAAAIQLANDNYALADSAYAVAAAELAKQKSLLQLASTSGANNTSGSIRDMGASASSQAGEYETALARMEQAEISLGQALRDRGQAQTTVNGSDYSGIIPATPIIPGGDTTTTTTPTGGGTGGGGGGGASAASETLKEYNGLMDEGKRLTESLWTEQEKYNEAMDQANRLLDVGAINYETYAMHTANLREELINAEWEEMIDGINAVSGAMIDAGMNAESYKDILGDMAEAGINALADLAAQMLKTYLMEQLLGVATAGMGGGGGAGGILGSLFGGARANGGPIEPGKDYLVGEDGPEIIQSNASAMVIPNNKIGPASDRQSASPDRGQMNVEVSPASVEVVVLDDPRKIDDYRTSPKGERERGRANRRLG